MASISGLLQGVPAFSGIQINPSRFGLWDGVYTVQPVSGLGGNDMANSNAHEHASPVAYRLPRRWRGPQCRNRCGLCLGRRLPSRSSRAIRWIVRSDTPSCCATRSCGTWRSATDSRRVSSSHQTSCPLSREHKRSPGVREDRSDRRDFRSPGPAIRSGMLTARIPELTHAGHGVFWGGGSYGCSPARMITIVSEVCETR